MKTIGERMRELRIARGMSQREVACKADIDHHTVWDIEHGRHLPNGLTTIALAEAFGVTTDYILLGIEESMTAVDFLKTLKKMCLKCWACGDCPLYEKCRGSVPELWDIDNAVAAVQKWAEENREEADNEG